jgi:hypothetical protein
MLLGEGGTTVGAFTKTAEGPLRAKSPVQLIP